MDDGTGLFAGVCLVPRCFQLGEVRLDLGAALGHQRVEGLEFGHLSGHRVEGQAVSFERPCECGVSSENRGPQRSDRALLLEQRGGVQATPLAGRPDAGADLEVHVAVRIAGPAGLVDHHDRLKALDRYHLLPTARPDPRDRVQREEPADLGDRVGLCRVQGFGYVGVQRGGDRGRLRGVDDHLGETR
jgi:hypothetical protein